MSRIERGKVLSAMVLGTLLPLLVLTTLPFESWGKANAVSQPFGSGIVWTNEPLSRTFAQIQHKFIGVVPGNYAEPTDSDYSIMRKAFSLIQTGISNEDPHSILAASSVARQVDYQLKTINDSDTGHRFFVLMEGDDVNRGWGSYFFVAEPNKGSAERVIIQAPHPVTDFNSQNIAYDIFTGSYPLVYSYHVAGVERNFGPNEQTDMAHRTLSIFETATESSVGPGAVLIQIHSFDAARHPGYPLVVLSSGDGGTNGALESIASNLRQSGLTVGIFDGFRYEALGGSDNVQGRYARAVWAGFVQAEISSTAVYNSTLISDFEGSVVQSLFQGFKFSGYQVDLRIPILALSVVVLLVLGRSRLAGSTGRI